MTQNLALTFVEVDIPKCVLRFGETTDAGTCPAVGSGDAKCFNTVSTCPVLESYIEGTVTVRFAKQADYLADFLEANDIDAIPAITSVELSPAMISLGEDLGQRASLNVSFRDFKWSDTGPGFDPYYAERSYDPYQRGTFWPKWRARQPYLRGRAIRVIRGFVGQALADMETRHYVIESFDGPTAEGSYSIIAKDVLKLLDGDRAQAPRLSNGFLAAPIDDNDTSFNLSPSGIGDEEYPASGYATIGGSEAVSFTRVGNAITLTGRGLEGSPAEAHEAQDRFQLAIKYDADNAADILYDLGVNYADVPPAQIDLTAWQQEVTSYNNRLYSAFIGEPTSVKTLYAELIEIVGLAIWGDEVNQRIRLQVLRQIATDAERFDDQNRLRGQLQIEEQPDRRLSRVWIWYGKKNALGGDEPENYRQSVEVVNSDAEINYGSPAIKIIFSRWIPPGGRSTALRSANTILNRFVDPPRRTTFPVFRIGPETPEMGEGCIVSAWPLVDATGARIDLPVQIVRMGVTDTEYRIVADEIRITADSDDPSIHDLTYDADFNGIDLIEAHNDLYLPPTGGETVNVYIEEFAIVGATAYGLPALDVGGTSDWPTTTFSGGRTNGSAVVTVADTTGFKVGMAVSGAGFTGYRRILSIVPNTSITLDANSSANGSTTLTLYTVIINIFVRGRLQGPGGGGGAGAYFISGPNIRTTAANGSAGGTALRTRYPINLFLDAGLARMWSGGGGGGGAGVLALSGHYGGAGGYGAGIPGASPDAGGGGSQSTASFNWYTAPFSPTGITGGSGGAPGSSGGAGGNHGGNGAEQQVGSGGAAGPAIDGVSFVKKTGTGDVRGSEIN